MYPDRRIDAEGSGCDEIPVRVSGIRAYARSLQSFVRKTDDIAEDQIAQIVRFAVNLRDDPDSTPRDRLRASELLMSIVNKGIDVAMYLDKSERVDDGANTERVEVIFRTRDGADIGNAYD